MRFADVMDPKRFAVVVQLDPPKGSDPGTLVETALAVRGRVDAVCMTDNPMAIMRMNPLAPCHLLQHRNVETILTVNGRDRNRLAFQSDLLAAWALGIRAVLLHPGGDPAFGDHPLAVPCNDVGLKEMLGAVAALAEGKDLAGQPVSDGPTFTAGVRIDVTDDEATNRQRAAELPTWAKLGARFAFLGPTYQMETIRMFADAASGSGIRIFASVLLLKSVGMAKYLNTMAGTPNVPEEIIQRIAKAPVKPKACVEIAAGFMRELREVCAGAVIVPLGWEARIPEVLDAFSA